MIGHCPPLPMDDSSYETLDLLASQLQEANLPYWLDSGALLGIARDRRIQTWEKDIDLGMEISLLPRLENVLARLALHGVQVSRSRYRGRVYAVGLRNGHRPASELLISIHLFSRQGDMLWSPQAQLYLPPPAPDVLAAPRSFAGRMLLRLVRLDRKRLRGKQASVRSQANWLRLLRHWINQQLDRAWLSQTWPMREIYVAMTWVYPRNLIMPYGGLEWRERRWPVPGRLDEYLSYRYGNWHSPRQEWWYWQDDGAILRTSPDKFHDNAPAS